MFRFTISTWKHIHACVRPNTGLRLTGLRLTGLRSLPLNFQARCKVWLIASSWSLVRFGFFTINMISAFPQVWRHLLFRHSSVQFPSSLQQSGVIRTSGSRLNVSNILNPSNILNVSTINFVHVCSSPLWDCAPHPSQHCTATSDHSNTILEGNSTETKLQCDKCEFGDKTNQMMRNHIKLFVKIPGWGLLWPLWASPLMTRQKRRVFWDKGKKKRCCSWTWTWTKLFWRILIVFKAFFGWALTALGVLSDVLWGSLPDVRASVHEEGGGRRKGGGEGGRWGEGEGRPPGYSWSPMAASHVSDLAAGSTFSLGGGFLFWQFWMILKQCPGVPNGLSFAKLSECGITEDC